MNSNLKNCLVTVCTLLQKYNVQYIIVGGTAVALNGYFRPSSDLDFDKHSNKPDLDIWYNPTYKNYFNILNVIEGLGEDITEFKNEIAPNPKNSFFRYYFKDFKLDLLPNIKSQIKFRDANKRKQIIELEDIEIHFMNYFDLIEDKKATARKKDLEDIEQLKKRNK